MQPKRRKGYALAIDVGGTFVDLTLCDLDSGYRWIDKILAERGPVEGFMTAITRGLELGGITVEQLSRIVHGTTLSTNVILERSNEGMVLVTTAGFEDVLEIGRHDSPRNGNIRRWIKPKRPIPRHRIIGVEERLAWDGSVLLALGTTEVERMLDRLTALQPTSVAVVLLYSYTNSIHEDLLAHEIERRLPGTPVSLSHEVLGQAGEYERTTATLLNAYVQPAFGEYVNALTAGLLSRNVLAPLYLMGSDGGIMSAADALALPIKTVLSGPAAGAAGAAGYAVQAGFNSIFSLDSGGTSTDVACAINGVVDTTVDGVIETFPIASPILDVQTIGAGGGSIAHVTDTEFSVGPRSAGARPGPICYGHGGEQPTVTDAQVTLGRLPAMLVGGNMSLDLESARNGIRRYIATVAGMNQASAAEAVIRLANVHMANAIRKISTERGRDPRDYVLLAFGGAGGAHAAEVAILAGISKVLIPPHPGVFTTEGLLAADLSKAYVRSLPTVPALHELRSGPVESMFAKLEFAGKEYLSVDPEVLQIRTERAFDLRYTNQGFTLSITVPSQPMTPDMLVEARSSFDSAHKARYSYMLPDTVVEVLSVRVIVRGSVPHAPRPKMKNVEPAVPLIRDVYFGETGWVPTAIHQRGTLPLGTTFMGPAIIEDYDSTIVLPPRTAAIVLADGGIELSTPDKMLANYPMTNTEKNAGIRV